MSLESHEALSSVIDHDELLMRCLNKLDFAERMLALFQNHCGEEMADLDGALDRRDLESVRRIAHRLAGASANAAAFGLQSRVTELRKAAERGSIDEDVERIDCRIATRMATDSPRPSLRQTARTQLEATNKSSCPPTIDMRVLVVEDDRVSSEFLRDSLTYFGYDVTTAENGAEAFELLRTGEFRIVVSDWEMPEMSGDELCRKVRARQVEQLHLHHARDLLTTASITSSKACEPGRTTSSASPTIPTSCSLGCAPPNGFSRWKAATSCSSRWPS